MGMRQLEYARMQADARMAAVMHSLLSLELDGCEVLFDDCWSPRMLLA